MSLVAPRPTAAQHRVWGGDSESSINTQNQWMRSQPWYAETLASFGQNPNGVKLSGNQRTQLLRAAQAHGMVVDEGKLEMDPGGNFNPKGHKLRNTLIAAGVGAGAVLAAPAVGGWLASAGAGAGASAGGAGAVAGYGGVAVPTMGVAGGMMPGAAAAVTGAGAVGTGGGMSWLSRVGLGKNADTANLVKSGIGAFLGNRNKNKDRQQVQGQQELAQSRLDPYRGQMYQASDAAILDALANDNYAPPDRHLNNRYTQGMDLAPRAAFTPSPVARNTAQQAMLSVAAGQQAPDMMDASGWGQGLPNVDGTVMPPAATDQQGGTMDSGILQRMMARRRAQVQPPQILDDPTSNWMA